MEEKNKASEMLHQMKKYIHGDKPDGEQHEVPAAEPEPSAPAESEAIATAEPEKVASSAPTEPEAVVPSAPAKPEKPIVRPLPDDDALFEFDEVAFDDVMVPDPPTLTPEEAEYADELREKFGVSSSVGIAFINEEPTEAEEKTFAPIVEPVTEEAPAVEEAPVIEEKTVVEEAPDFEEEPVAQEMPVVEESIVDEAPAVEELIDEEAPAVEEMLTAAPSANGEPEQVVFSGIEEAVPEERSVPTRSDEPMSGVQLTFLDAEEEEYYTEPEPEQIAFDEEGVDSFDETSNDDESDEPEGQAYAEAPAELDDSEEISDDEPDLSSYEAEPIEKDSAEETEAEYGEPIDDDPLYDGVSGEEQSQGELTALERNAIEEEAERARIEAEAESAAREESEQVKAKSYDSDVWDEADRPLYVAKKRYMDYCEGLTVPPMRLTKDTAAHTPSGKPESSGYRYEMTERLPLFADGRNGGKNTEGYKNREMEYCEEREKKRSAQLLDKLRLSSKKLMFSFVIMLAVMIIENIGIFFAGTPDALLGKANPVLFGLIASVLLAVDAVLVFDALRDGIKCAFKGVFILESMTACITAPTIIYHIVISFTAKSSQYAMLFGTGAAISMFLTALYRYISLKRDHIAFTVTSSYGEYLTEVKHTSFKNSPEGEAFGDYVEEDASLYRMNRVSRIDGSYIDKPVRDECFGLIRKLLLCVVCFAVVAGVVFGIIRRDVTYGVLSGLSLLAFASPISAFLAVSLPRLRATSVSAELGGAIVDYDEESDELDESVIMIDDGELFPTENLISSNFEIYSASVEAHLARTLALFKKIGGPIAVVFNNVEGTVDHFDSIYVTEITEQGIQAKIDGRPICAGSESFMKRMGIKISRYDKLLPKNGRVMYIADDGEFFARLILIFKPDAELVRKISELRNTGTVFSLKTCNPCIDRELLFYTTGLEPDLLRLVKYKAGDDVAPAETDREGALVSKGGALGLLTALLEYKRQKKLVRDASVFACVSCGIGAFVSLLISAIGFGRVGFTSLIALALHGALSLAAFLMSRRGVIDTKTKIKKK